MKRKYEREFTGNDCLDIIEKTKIGVVGVGRGVGTSFVATSIALKIAENREKSVAFVELIDEHKGKTWIYDSIGMDKRFSGRKYNSIYGNIKQGRYIRSLVNMDMGINWALPDKKYNENYLTDIQQARLINNVRGDVIVCDFGLSYESEGIADMDVLVCVVDPKPSRLIAARNIYQKMKQEQLNGRQIIWVLNKSNGGVNKRCLNEYIKIKGAFEIPLIKDIHFYAAEYNCRIPIEQKEIRKIVDNTMEDIVKATLL